MKKIKFGRKCRLGFSFFIMAIMLLLAVVYPVVAAEFEATTSAKAYTISYVDGSLGNINYNHTGNVFDNWSLGWTDSRPWFNVSVESGIKYGGIFESEATLNGSESITSIYTCYQPYFTGGNIHWNPAGYEQIVNITPMIRFYIELTEEEIMNGASECWYRSPLKWDNTIYNETFQHTAGAGGMPDSVDEYNYHWWLNIYDEDDNIVFATSPRLVNNFSHRLYTEITMPFRSNIKYRFEEFVKVIDENPIMELGIFFANHQDIGNDNNTDTYIFPYTPYAKKIPMECSWSMIFVIGMGRAGMEYLLDHNMAEGPNYGQESGHFQIVTQRMNASGLNNVASVNITIPFRTTVPVNVSVRINVTSADKYWQSPRAYIHDVTGTIQHQMSITDPDAANVNEYWLELRIYNLTEDGKSMYLMYPVEGGGTLHNINIVCRNETGVNITKLYDVSHFQFHYEITENSLAYDGDDSQTLIEALLGLIVIGYMIAKYVPALGALIMVIGTVAIGAVFIIHGALVVSGALWNQLANIGAGVLEAILAFGRWVWGGLAWVAENLWNGLLWVIEQAIQVGEAIVYWGAIILHAVAEIVWLVAFLYVLMLWNLFLTTMKYILKGDPEGAWKAFKRPIKPTVAKAKKLYRIVKKAKPKKRRS